MNCKDINRLLSAYLDEEVNPGERKLIEDHFPGCKKCQEELRLLSSTREALRQALSAKADVVEPPNQAWDQIRQRIVSEHPFWYHFSEVMRNQTWRTAIPIALFVIAIGVLWGTGVLPRLAGFETAAQESVPKPQVITFAPGSSGSASWVSGFEDLGELCNSSDVIVLGTVDRVIEVVPDEYGHGMLYDARSAFRIDNVLKGKIGNEIVLSKMALAGENGWLQGMAEDPPFESGERWVLFLSSDLSYHNLGPWGRYKIIDDKVYSMNRLVASYDAYGEGNLDFNGVDLSTFIANINETLDSVVLTITDSRIDWAIAPAVRFDAGGFEEVNINLSTGKYEPGDLTYIIRRVAYKDNTFEMPIPDEMKISVNPAQFTAYSRSMYHSILRIETTSDVSPGTYWIRVEYQFGKSMSGYRDLMVNINP